MKFEPIIDNVLIKVIEDEKKTSGGIYIPDTAKEKSNKGEVVAFGKECKYVKKGDVVAFGKYIGMELKIENQSFLLLKEVEILGKFGE